MVLSAGKCPLLCWVGCLWVLGCRGETLVLPYGAVDMPASAAQSGGPAAAGVPASGAGAPAPAGVGSGWDGPSGGGAGGAAAGVTGGQASAAGGAGSAGSSWLQEGTAGAAEGGSGGSGGRRGLGQWLAQAGTGGRSSGRGGEPGAPGSAGSAANGCVKNLACQLPAPPSTGDVHQDCVDRINQFRQECACLQPLERWVEGEACANQMAKYDSEGGDAHAGFGDNICNGGSAQNECPGWRSEEQIISGCLQRMWDEGPPPMSDCNGSCFQMYGHFLNMSNQRVTKVACGFHETEDGQVWSVQNFTR
jgi:hypothetical protein